MRAFLKRDGISIGIILFLTCVMTNPLVLHLANAVEDKQDSLLNVWIIAWVGHALITAPLNLFNANIFYPYPNTLAYSETLLPQGLFALPFNLAFNNTILGYNLVLLASFFLAAYAMYLCVFELTRHRGAALIAGTIFAFNPYNLGNLAQVQLLSFGWLPLAIMYLRKLLTEDQGRRTTQGIISRLASRNSILFALFFSLQALASFYYAFLAGFAVALYIVWDLIVHRQHRSTVIRVLFSAVMIALVVIPFFLPYLQVQREMGFERTIAESEPFSASLKLYTEVSPQNLLYGNLLAPRPPIMLGGYPLDNLFPGVIAIVLAMIGLGAAKNRDRWFYLILFAFAFMLSLGPRLFLAPSVSTDLILPYHWLYDFFPLMKALRAPVRFDALVMFALAVLAGLGFQKATGRMPNAENRLLPTAFCLLLIFFIMLEYLALPAANITPVPVWAEIPQYVRWLAQQPPGAILELPMIASDPTQPLDLTTQYLSTYHWHTTPDGYSGFNPPRRGEIAYEMKSFPNERSLGLLQKLDTEFVIIQSKQLGDWNQQRETLGHVIGIQLAQQLGDTFIYRVVHLPSSAALAAQMYLPNPAAPNQTYFADLIIRNRGQSSFAIKPTDELRLFAIWSNGTRVQINAQMPLVTSSVSIVPIRLTAPAQPGNYQLQLQVFGDGLGPWDLTGNVTVSNGDAIQQALVPARVALYSTLKTQYAAGETLALDLTWLPLNKIDAYYSVSVRIVDAHGNKIAAVDREPMGRTFLWTPNVAVPDQFTLTLPPNPSPGAYTIQVKMYQADQGIDALLLDENYTPHETITLGTFTVK